MIHSEKIIFLYRSFSLFIHFFVFVLKMKIVSNCSTHKSVYGQILLKVGPYTEQKLALAVHLFFFCLY